MAVDEKCAWSRLRERRILEGLEAEATRPGAQKRVLNARDNATEFYAKHDCEVVGDAETLFGAVRSVRVAHVLPQANST